MNDSLNLEPMDAAINAAKAELQSLQSERAYIEARLAEVLTKIDRRNEFLRLASEMRNEGRKPQGPAQEHFSLTPPVPLSKTRILSENQFTTGSTIRVDPQVMLTKFPKSGYGVITRAVEALLKTSDDGYPAKWLVDQIEKAKFEVRDSHETAVRSALKNLRNQKKVVYDDDTGKYKLTNETALG